MTTTAKGERQAEAIIDATLTCLARDGYAATSLQRVADAACVQKRMVVYYFGSRTGLITAVVERMGDLFLGRLADTMSGLDNPADILTAGLEGLWTQVADERALQIAYFGLLAESVADEDIAAALSGLRERGRALANEILDELEAAGYELQMDRDTLLMLAEAGVNGLGVELVTRGETDELRRAVSMAELAVQFVFEQR